MASKTDVWMPLYIADYLADTNRLTTLQHGAYMLLIMDYWRNGALPDDDSILAQVTKMPLDAWSITRAVLERFFSIENGSWIHARIEAEKEKAGVNTEKAHARAVKAAQARWGNDSYKSNAQSNAQSNAKAILKQCPSPSPIKPINQSINADERVLESSAKPQGAAHPEKFAMHPAWQPSPHVADLARQSGTVLLPADLPDLVAHWLTEPQTVRTQSEWDKALLQTAKHRALRAASLQPSRAGRMPPADNFAGKNYGVGVQDL